MRPSMATVHSCAHIAQLGGFSSILIHTDGRTDGRTYPFIEMQGSRDASKNRRCHDRQKKRRKEETKERKGEKLRVIKL